MAKDKIIGFVILAGAAGLLIIYSLWLVGGYIQQTTGTLHNTFGWIPSFFNLPWELAVIAPLELVAILVLAIAMWIGYSMLTTPPPVPLGSAVLETPMVKGIGGGARSRGKGREEEGRKEGRRREEGRGVLNH